MLFRSLQPCKYRIISSHGYDPLVLEAKGVNSVATALCRYRQPPILPHLLQLRLVIREQANVLNSVDCCFASVTDSEGPDRALGICFRKPKESVVDRQERRKVWASATQRMTRGASSNCCHQQHNHSCNLRPPPHQRLLALGTNVRNGRRQTFGSGMKDCGTLIKKRPRQSGASLDRRRYLLRGLPN